MIAEAGSAGRGAGNQVEHRPGPPPAGGGSPGPVAVPEAPPRSRKEMREARSQRQILLLWCAVAVAAALAVTVVILGVARDRPFVQHNPAAAAAYRVDGAGQAGHQQPTGSRAAPGGGAL